MGNTNFGDSTEWYVRRDSTLWVKGLAHCGQQGDRRRIATADLVSTAGDAVAVRAHAGKTNHRRQDGVMSAGGKCYRQLGPHGLGDQADRWGRWFDRVRAIAIDLRHSAAIRTDSSLCAWEESFDIAPRRLREAIVHYGLTAADLGLGSAKPKAPKGAAVVAAAKFKGKAAGRKACLLYTSRCV